MRSRNRAKYDQDDVSLSCDVGSKPQRRQIDRNHRNDHSYADTRFHRRLVDRAVAAPKKVVAVDPAKGRRRKKGKNQAWTKKTLASAVAVAETPIADAPVRVAASQADSLIDVQDEKSFEALEIIEMGSQEPIAFMDIDVGAVKELVGAALVCSDLHRLLLADLEELE